MHIILLRQEKVMDKERKLSWTKWNTLKYVWIFSTPKKFVKYEGPYKNYRNEDTKSRKIKNKLSPKSIWTYTQQARHQESFIERLRHKLAPTGTIDDLTILSIMSIIATASCQLAKHRAKLLSLLSTSEYEVTKNIEFINNIKSEKVPGGHSLYLLMWNHYLQTSLHYTTNMILRRIYGDSELFTNISKTKMKELFFFEYKKRTFYFKRRNILTMWRCSSGVTFRTCDHCNIYNKIRKVINSKSDGAHDSLERICRWHYGSYKVNIYWICIFNSQQVSSKYWV